MNNLRRRVESNSGITGPTDGRKMIGNYEVVDLGLPSGLLWATCNVRAKVGDETSYGKYYMYGKGSQTYTYGDTGYTGTENPLKSSADTARKVMGSTWRMPTSAEIYELLNNTDYEFVTNFNGSGVNGGKFTSKSNPNAYIFFPAAGCYSNDGTLSSKGGAGYYWSSTPYRSSGFANALSLYDGSKKVTTYRTWYGYSVRGVHAAV